jgi:hypothetical protein
MCSCLKSSGWGSKIHMEKKKENKSRGLNMYVCEVILSHEPFPIFECLYIFTE